MTPRKFFLFAVVIGVWASLAIKFMQTYQYFPLWVPWTVVSLFLLVVALVGFLIYTLIKVLFRNRWPWEWSDERRSVEV